MSTAAIDLVRHTVITLVPKIVTFISFHPSETTTSDGEITCGLAMATHPDLQLKKGSLVHCEAMGLGEVIDIGPLIGRRAEAEITFWRPNHTVDIVKANIDYFKAMALTNHDRSQLLLNCLQNPQIHFNIHYHQIYRRRYDMPPMLIRNMTHEEIDRIRAGSGDHMHLLKTLVYGGPAIRDLMTHFADTHRRHLLNPSVPFWQLMRHIPDPYSLLPRIYFRLGHRHKSNLPIIIAESPIQNYAEIGRTFESSILGIGRILAIGSLNGLVVTAHIAFCDSWGRHSTVKCVMYAPAMLAKESAFFIEYWHVCTKGFRSNDHIGIYYTIGKEIIDREYLLCLDKDLDTDYGVTRMGACQMILWTCT